MKSNERTQLVPACRHTGCLVAPLTAPRVGPRKFVFLIPALSPKQTE